MKISFINWALTRLPRGLERVGAMLANELVTRGHEVEILVYDPDKHASVFPLHNQVELHYIGDLAGKEERDRALQHLKDWGSDVVASMFTWHGMLYVSQMLVDSNIPYLISEHSTPENIIPRWNAEERLAAMSVADRIHMLMPDFKNSLPEYIQRRVIDIPNAVKTAIKYASPAGSDAKKTILVVSSFIEENKQVSQLVHAFALIHDQFPQWQIRIFGSGKDEEYIKKLITEHDLENKLILCGHTDNLEIEYQGAQLFCLPSKYEGCPCALQEAQAHGLPAIGFAECTGTNHLIKNEVNGLLASEMTPESLAESLQKLMLDDELRTQYGIAAIESSQEYTSEKVYDQWELLLEETAAIKATRAQSKIDPFSADAKWRAELLRLSKRNHPTLPVDPQRNIGYPRVSVIVPIYNVEDYLFECLDSIFSQTLKDIEIICVNDVSTDNSAELLEKISKTDSRVTILKHEINRGLAAARNTGMEIARGDFIYFLDSDDFLARDDSLEILYIAALEDFSDIAIGGVVRWNAETGNHGPGWHGKYMISEEKGKVLKKLPQLKSNVVAWNKMLRREFLVNHNIRFDEALRKHEDDPFTCKAHILAKRISIRPIQTYVYRQGRTDSIMASLKKDDVFYRSEVCRQVFQFIESSPDYICHREHFYQRYSAQLLNCVELLFRFSPTKQEKDRLWELLKRTASYLPNHLPGIDSNKKQAFKEIQKGMRELALSSAIVFTYTRPLSSKKHKVSPEISCQFRTGVKTHRILSEQIMAVTLSRSWRITKGLRYMTTLIRQFKFH